MNSYDILVIILSIMLTIFLGLAIVLTAYLVKFVKNLKEISEKAKEMVNDASSVAATMKKAAAPTVVAKFVADQISNAVKKHSKDKE
jgi:heme/copper-type cytochrome/quinol oxidase subunit 2